MSDAGDAPMLELHEIVVRFGARTVVEAMSAAVGRGEIVALLGPSGSGKSTLLRVVAGLLRPDAGEVRVGGRDVTEVPAHRRNVGMVFQDDQLFPHLDVAGNVAFGMRMGGVGRRTIETRVASVLDLVGLAGFGARRIGRLSGGEAKRVALARSLAPQPAVLLLDEPLTGLDRELHDRLVTDLAALLRSTGTTAVLVTHDHDEAAAIADRTVRLPGPAEAAADR